MMNWNNANKAAILVTLFVPIFGYLVAFDSEVLSFFFGLMFSFFVVFFLILLRDIVFSKKQVPRFYDLMLFLLLFSGPPRFRERDPMASLTGEIDWVVILNVVVWSIGALWILNQMINHRSVKLQRLEKLALFFAGALFLSLFVSPAPKLTGFRVFQIIVMILFAHYWLWRYGIEVTLRALFFGYVVLALSIFGAAWFKPELVYVGTRLRGDYIANAGPVGAIGLILLFGQHRLRAHSFMLLLVAPLLTWILLVSRTRSSYAAFIIFLLLTIIRSPRFKHLKILKYFIVVSIPIIILFPENIFSFLIREKSSLYTLSDRTRIWAGLFSFTLTQSPLFGLGFCAERIITLQINPGVGTAHGALAAVFGGAGFIGTISFITLVITLINMAIQLFKRSKNDLYSFIVLGILLAVFTIGIVSIEMVVASPTGFVFYMMPSLISHLQNFWKSRKVGS